jgi:DNA primase
MTGWVIGLGGFPQGFIESVRDAGDIVRLISEYVPLKPSGSRRMKGLCPFHEEKTPSFTVNPENQLFYCFGCQTGGDLFKFVMLYEKVDFVEAVKMLAGRFGIPLPTPTRGPDDPYERLLEMNKSAADFFRKMLKDPEAGRGCRAYLEKRGITSETAGFLGLGYAPDAWEALRGHLLAKRFTPQEMLRGGLVQDRRSGSGQYDRFRDRLIFPIRDLSGRAIAFGGRALGDAEAKYINSPETPTYTKGEHLYGLDLAAGAIRREKAAIVVEGYMDLAALLQAGFENVVASLGTAFTPAQARRLARYTERVVFSYDGDSAGAAATARSLDLLLEKGFDVRVVDLPSGVDPDDYIRQKGAKAYGKLLRDAPEYLEFLVRREAVSRDLSRVRDKIAAVNAVLPHVSKLGNAIERASWAGRLADALQIEDDLVLQELRAALKTAQQAIRHRPRPSSRPPREAEARMVNLLLRSEEERARWKDELDPEDLARTEVAPIIDTILRLAREGGQVDHPAVLTALAGEAERDLFMRITFRDEPEAGPTVEDCLWACRRERLQRRGKEVASEIGRLQKAAGSPGDSNLDERLAELQRLAKQRDALQ